jgi:tRNAThr (cytosine32-N3)-methyltransferase
VIHAAVWDATSPDILPNGLEPMSADIVILIFVLSALHPKEWEQTILNVHKVRPIPSMNYNLASSLPFCLKILKPGGLVVFRDYGRHDLTQLRFKGGRYLEDNFYIRGDKTRVYFFDIGRHFDYIMIKPGDIQIL